MAPKRKEISSPQKMIKKAKRDPLVEKLREVTVALSKADITRELEKMMETVLPLSLGEFSDQRHRYQEQVVEATAEILGEVERTLKQDVADKRSQRDTAVAEKPLCEREATEATSKLDAKIAEVQRLKVALAEAARAFRAAKTELDEAEEAKVKDGQKAREAEKKKSDFLGAAENLSILKTVAPEEADASKRSDELMVLLKLHKFEESMMIALPAALAKSPDARGQFDLMAITQLEGEIEKLVAEQDAILAAAAPVQAKCEAAIKAAQEQLTRAKGEQRAAAQAFDVASKEQAECEATSAAMQKAVRSNLQLSKKLESSLNDAEVEVELFEQGPRETFKSLRERITPPPMTEVHAEEETASPEPMAEELAPANELEVPLVAVA